MPSRALLQRHDRLPLRAVRLLLEVGAGDERLPEYRILDTVVTMNQSPPSGLLMRVKSGDDRVLAVGHAVAAEPAAAVLVVTFSDPQRRRPARPAAALEEGVERPAGPLPLGHRSALQRPGRAPCALTGTGRRREPRAPRSAQPRLLAGIG